MDTPITENKPVLLCILDGWGIREEESGNAIKLANTPNFDRIINEYPNSQLLTSGLDVGLPDGQMGNSEVGHMSIGSGRIIEQDLVIIDREIREDTFKDNTELKAFIDKLKTSGGACHLMGMISDGGTHGHQDHVVALAKIIDDQGITVHIHGFLDGRDTPPKSGNAYMKKMVSDISDLQSTNISTISGRYYAMDRDNRWDRTELAYKAIVSGQCETYSDPVEIIEQSYQNEQYDEFIKPVKAKDYEGMDDVDGFLMANFRVDRPRQILTSLVSEGFNNFNREKVVNFAAKLGMVEYSEELNSQMSAMFVAEDIKNTLGHILEKNNLKQLRIAETEKFNHVTYYFSGGIESLYEGEDRILIPSPDVKTYDLQPEMSAPEVTDKLVEAIETGGYDFIVVNYANPDMVGHSGNIDAAIKAVEAVDESIGNVVEAIKSKGGVMLITADHGNVEMMRYDNKDSPHTAHTNNPVPFIVIGGKDDIVLKSGRLCDLAPTILELMNIDIPAEMTGEVLF